MPLIIVGIVGVGAGAWLYDQIAGNDSKSWFTFWDATKVAVVAGSLFVAVKAYRMARG